MAKDWSKPIPIDNPYPAHVTGTYLPPKEDIPKEFLNHYNPYHKLASDLFFNGGVIPEVKEGIDYKMARAQIVYCLSSFEPKHELKEAGVGYLLSLWLKDELE